MNYNEFTINYIEAIKSNLNIEVNSKGEAIFFPERIGNNNLINLKQQLAEIWDNADSAINIVKNKYDSDVQSGLFGLVDDLVSALKVGFLISDRVILLDYLYERILLKKNPDEINLDQLGAIANSLVEFLPLAKNGRIVIIPTPFNWNNNTKKIINEVSSKTLLTMELMSMLNMLSITKVCNLHPYTIAESERNYQNIINEQIDNVDVMEKDTSQYAYEGILGALLSEKLLHKAKFNFALNLPIDKYIQVISSNKDFYTKYLSQITAGGSLNANNNIKKLERDLHEYTQINNKEILYKAAKGITNISSVSAATIALLSSISAVSTLLTIAGGLLGLSATLTALINNSQKKEDTIISVFHQLNK